MFLGLLKPLVLLSSAFYALLRGGLPGSAEGWLTWPICSRQLFTSIAEASFFSWMAAAQVRSKNRSLSAFVRPTESSCQVESYVLLPGSLSTCQLIMIAASWNPAGRFSGLLPFPVLQTHAARSGCCGGGMCCAASPLQGSLPFSCLLFLVVLVFLWFCFFRLGGLVMMVHLPTTSSRPPRSNLQQLFAIAGLRGTNAPSLTWQQPKVAAKTDGASFVCSLCSFSGFALLLVVDRVSEGSCMAGWVCVLGFYYLVVLTHLTQTTSSSQLRDASGSLLSWQLVRLVASKD